MLWSMTRNFLSARKNHIRTYDNILKTINDNEDDYTTSYLFDYTYFKENYKLIAIDVSKQALDLDQKAIQQIIAPDEFY